jgi:ADP-dependent NAD(P)H-hydrate dehydratase / NAD(P)H-hydrate epimerase
MGVDWREPLLDAELMRATDRWAIEERGIPSLELMERAGNGLARVTEVVAPAGRVVVLCGKGNNGGDGLVAARLLRGRGREVDVQLVGDAADLRGDARTNLERLPGAAPGRLDLGALEGAAVAVDALLGTGFAGDPRGPLADAIAGLNDSGVAVVAADVPSGVDASTGEVAAGAVRAVATATFHAGKPGLWISPGKEHCGQVEVIEIGIPADAPGQPAIGLIDPGVLRLAPSRASSSTKFSSGHVLVVGGSEGLTGAPCLASESAMRAGAGYVTAAIPRSLNPIFEARLLEVMTRPLPDADGHLVPDALEPVREEAVRRGGALVLGPGLGRSDAALELARRVAADVDVALVLDADGLNAHAGRLDELAARSAHTVLTPHAGELGRLLEIDSDAVAAQRLRRVREAAQSAGCVVVLKGDDTLVATPEGQVGVSRGGSPALATAGTGDVLSGVVAALLARGLEPFAAACAGVWAHAEAGRLAAAELSVDGVVASDVIAHLPRAMRR